MLKIIYVEQARQIREKDQKIDQLQDAIFARETDRVCIAHGGHEFEKRGDMGMKYEACKFCNKTKDDL